MIPRGTRPLPSVPDWTVFTDGSFIWYEHDSGQRVDISIIITEPHPVQYLEGVLAVASRRQSNAGAPR